MIDSLEDTRFSDNDPITQLLRKLSQLDPIQKERLIYHDFDNTVNFLGGLLDLLGDDSLIGEYNQIEKRDIQSKTECALRIIHRANAVSPEDAKSLLDLTTEQLSRFKALEQFFPVLAASAQLLDQPTRANYTNLHNQQASIDLIAQAASVTLANPPPIALPGEEAVAIFNLLINARKAELEYLRVKDNRQFVPLEVIADGQTTMIMNKSVRSLPPLDQLRQFPPSTVYNSHGYGFPIALAYATLAGRTVNITNQSLVNGYQIAVGIN